MSAFGVSLGEGRELLATHVPGKKNPYLGIKQGATFVAVARFLSDEDMEFLFQSLQNVVVLPISDGGP